MSGPRVVVTENFVRNLDGIQEFLEEQDAVQAFDELVETIFERLVPNLERFPEIGRDFLERSPLSMEGQAKLQLLRAEIGPDTSIREYISGSYLMLYAHRRTELRRTELFLLAIKLHRQLSFNLLDHWR